MNENTDFHIREATIDDFEAINAIFKEGDEMTVWVSDDKNRIPLLVETPILVGSIKAKVQSIKNNKYPLTSLIKKI